MSLFKVFMLSATMHIASSMWPEQVGSGGSDTMQNDSLNDPMADSLVTVPIQVLKALVDISDKSKGLILLYRNSFYLTKEKLLKSEFKHPKSKACTGIDQLFHEQKTVCQRATACLNRSKLVNYYNQLVIHLGVAEKLLITSISKEIHQNSRTVVEKRQRKVIELLRENILPLMDAVLNVTDDEIDCNSTETIVSNKMSQYYQHCASIQTANFLLSQTTIEFYRILNSIYLAHMNNHEDHSSKNNEIGIGEHDGTKVWCISNTTKSYM